MITFPIVLGQLNLQQKCLDKKYWRCIIVLEKLTLKNNLRPID